jgi:hypothetical protein
MKYLKYVDVNQIAQYLKLMTTANGKFDCPHLLRHEGCYRNSGLSIAEDGSFSCLCGINGKGWINLVSKIYKVPRWQAEKWLQRQLKRLNDGKS